MTTSRNLEFLLHLEGVIHSRLETQGPESYTARLVSGGRARVAQKVAEEAVEVALASATDSGRQAIVGEAADLVYHLLVLLSVEGIALGDVSEELAARHRNRTS